MSTRLGVVLTLVLGLLAGCASKLHKGEAFAPVRLSSPERAIIYFYRPPNESLGWGRTYFLTINERKVVDLTHGGYFPYETDSGTFSLASDVNKTLTMFIPLLGAVIEAAANPQAARLELTAQPGHTYYIRMHPEASFTHFTPTLNLVSKGVGEIEISACKLISNKP